MNRRILSLAVATLLSACSTPPQPLPDNSASGAISIEALKSHIDFLADDLLEGRATGTRGYDIAAKYVAAQFQQLGLRPAGSDGSWFQSFETVEERLVPGSAEVIIHRKDGDLTLTENIDFLIGGSYTADSNDITAPVSFAGYGVWAPDLDYNDYEGLDVDGHIVASFAGAPPTFDHNQRAYHSTGQVKNGTAAARGAVANLTFFTDDRIERYDWEYRVKAFGFSGMRWVNSNGDVQGVYPPIEAGVVLSPAAIEKLLDGGPLTPAEIQRHAADGETGSANLPVSMTIRRRSEQISNKTSNVAAILPGSDPELANEFVVITAHLDHLGIGQAVDGDVIYNGAYDNAAGIAYLLEVARLFSVAESQPARSILFLAVSGEEKGLLGSDYFANNPTVPIDSIVANINLDMPLLLYPPADVVAFGAEHSSLEGTVDKAAGRTGFALSPDPMPEEVLFVRSDQYAFVKKGIPAVFLVPGFTSSDPSIDGHKEFMHFLGNVYHSPADEVGLPFDEESALRFGLLNYEVILAIANDPERPTWNDGDFFGKKFSRAGY
jgi:hypothetical protein